METWWAFSCPEIWRLIRIMHMQQSAIDRYLIPYGACGVPQDKIAAWTGNQSWMLVGTCTRTKSERQFGTPNQIYVGWLLEELHRTCEHLHIPYGVLSDLHGVVWHDELIETYDAPPDGLQDEDFNALGQKLRAKTQKRYPKLKGFVMITINPVRSRPYARILKGSRYPWTWLVRPKLLIESESGLGL